MTDLLTYTFGLYVLYMIVWFATKISKWQFDFPGLKRHIIVLVILFLMFLLSSFIEDFLVPHLKGQAAVKQHAKELKQQLKQLKNKKYLRSDFQAQLSERHIRKCCRR